MPSLTCRFLLDGSEMAPATVLLAPGAGGAMDSPGMTGLSAALAGTGLRVARFEFAYMAARRQGIRRPPPRAETLVDEYRSAFTELGASGPLVIGGKSMGGRDASLVADELFGAGAIVGLLCVGYPFHPKNRPDRLRPRT